MQTVIDHIRARQGKSNPLSGDGKKITLVLYGGIMLGARGAGALLALEEMGYGKAFDEIYTMSSGFLNASYFLSGQIEEGLKAYAVEFSGSRFLNRQRFWKVADIDYLVSVTTAKRPLDVEAIIANPTKLRVMLINAGLGRPEYLEVHDFSAKEYPAIIRAASSLPFVGRGKTRIGNAYYRDIFRDGNLPAMMRQVLSTDATDIFVLYNYPWQEKYVNAKVNLAAESQRIFQICLGGDMSRFDTRPEVMERIGEEARKKTIEIFSET